MTKWEWYQKSEMVHLFLHLLLLANHEQGHWQGHTIERGQLITGLHSLKRDTGISTRTLRTCLERLKSTGEITSKTTNKFRIITIVKYEDYQSKKEKTTSKTTSKTTNNRQANDNQTTTNNNVNNDNNVNNKESGAEAPTPSQIMTKFINEPEEQEKVILALEGRGMERETSSAEIKKFLNYWCELTKSGKQQRWQTEKTFELQRRLATWFNNAQKFNKTNIIKSL